MTAATTRGTGQPSAATAPTRWVPQFLALGVLWGSSFAFIGIGLGALSPVQVAFVRVALGAVTLGAVATVTRTRLPRSVAVWGHLVVVAMLLNAVPFTLFAIGQQHVSSVLAAIINAATPLATLVVVLVALPEERPTAARLAGLLTGFIGILVVLGVWRALPQGELGGIVACLAAIGCYGLAFPYLRRHLSGSGVPPVALATGQTGLATLMLLPVVLLTGIRPTGPVTLEVVLAMVSLGALGSGIAYVLNFHVVARAGATTASSVTYLTPLVATVVGVTFLGEHVTWNEPVGAVVVLVGVAVSQGRLLRRR